MIRPPQHIEGIGQGPAVADGDGLLSRASCHGEGGDRRFEAKCDQLCGLVVQGSGDGSGDQRANEGLDLARIGFGPKRSDNGLLRRFGQLELNRALSGGDGEARDSGFRKR